MLLLWPSSSFLWVTTSWYLTKNYKKVMLERSKLYWPSSPLAQILRPFPIPHLLESEGRSSVRECFWGTKSFPPTHAQGPPHLPQLRALSTSLSKGTWIPRGLWTWIRYPRWWPQALVWLVARYRYRGRGLPQENAARSSLLRTCLVSCRRCSWCSGFQGAATGLNTASSATTQFFKPVRVRKGRGLPWGEVASTGCLVSS